jgi:hypothetical protein
MTTDVETNMEKVSMTKTRHRLLVGTMVRKASMRLMPVARKHPLAIRNYVMMM